jgi:integrase
MSVEYRPTSRFWYGRWQADGIRFCKRLKVPIAGKPGSDAFEKSRLAAEEALAAFREKAAPRQREEDILQSLHEVKFGRRVGTVPLTRLPEEWAALPRKRAVTRARLQYGRRVLGDFVAFMRDRYPKVKEMAGVTSTMAEEFMATLDDEKVTGRTYNEALNLLRGAFERLRLKAGMLANPFRESLIHKEENSIPRKPFTLEELERLWTVAKPIDPEIHDLLVLGACTALRRGDAACLKWEDVDLPGNRIRIKTRKTGEKVSIPIFPRLRQVLEARPRTKAHVFPVLADLYESQTWELNRRLNTVFRAAGFHHFSNDGEGLTTPTPLDVDIPDDESMREQVLAKIEGLTPKQVSPRIKDTMREVFDLYSTGTTLPDIAKQLEISKGSAMNYLKRIESVAGFPIIRREVRRIQDMKVIAASGPGETEPERPDKRGKLRVNNRGFHALRATFTTQALAAGVPVEVVKMITGHTITETVLKHYFNPDEQTLFSRMQGAMPKLITQGSKSPKDTLLAYAAALPSRITDKHRRELAALIEAL